MNHRTKVWLAGAGLILAAIAIWARDLRWLPTASDALPLALGLPMAFFLGQPWLVENPQPCKKRRNLAVIGAIAFVIGWVTGSLTVLSLAWTAVCVAWASWGFTSKPRRGRLAWLLLLSFPWLVIEWPQIGWAFRFSSAYLAEGFFGLLALPVEREGTHLNVMGVPVEIEAACAGWNLLQLTLLAGVALGAHEIKNAGRFYGFLAFLPVLAWIANLVRILVLTGIALSFDVDTAAGAIHGLMGLIVLIVVLSLTKMICSLLNPSRQMTKRVVTTS